MYVISQYISEYIRQCFGVEGADLVPWAVDPPDVSFWVLPKRSIPKPDQHRKDIIQQE